MLEKFGRHHRHLISLLATYEQFKSFHLIFYWAEADLLHYWRQVNPMPSMQFPTLSWMAEQCQGIAAGLAKIHRFELVPHQTNQFNTSYGRHGDIKPQNILWFRDPSNAHEGTLQITDFGHAESSWSPTLLRVRGSKAAFSPSYRPPECDVVDGLVSPSSDIWTLGCLYLEFVTWLFGGWSLVEEFSNRRLTIDPFYASVHTDTFFEIAPLKKTGNLGVSIKQAVLEVS